MLRNHKHQNTEQLEMLIDCQIKLICQGCTVFQLKLGNLSKSQISLTFCVYIATWLASLSHEFHSHILF